MWKLPVEALCQPCVVILQTYLLDLLSLYVSSLTPPTPPPHFSLSLPPVDCHWAEITPVLLTRLGTRVKHTQGETW